LPSMVEAEEFSTTHVNFRRQQSYGTPNVSLWVVELYDSLSCIRICTFVCFVADT